MIRPVVTAIALGAVVTGCAAARPILTPPDDWAAYRRTRTAPSLDERLAAGEAYLEHFPDGAFRGDVRAWFDRAEPAFFDARRADAKGLEGYLRALPHGPHAREAYALLRVEREGRDSPDEAGRQAAATEARLAMAAAKRAAARDAVAAWGARFLDPAAWSGRVAEAPAALVVPWSLGLPAPSCRSYAEVGAAVPPGGRRCTKIVEIEYPVLVGAVAEPRQLTLQIDATEDADGRLVAVTLAGPSLFTRLEETYAVRAIAADDGPKRLDAIVRQIDAWRAAFEAHVAKGPDCKQKPVAPTVLSLACGGFALQVVAGEGAEDDAVTMTRRPK
jgi:hypothetical protein